MNQLNLWVGVISGVLAIGVAIGSFTTWAINKRRDRRQYNLWLKALQEATGEGEVAVCIGVGGLGIPQPDVIKYLCENHPNIKDVLLYQAPTTAKMDDPAIARRILEDVSMMIRAYGQQQTSRVHFFPAGMVAYSFMAGAMLGNLCTVVVYHHLKDKHTYLPLYQWNRESVYRPKRATKPLAKWVSVPIPCLSNGAPELPLVTASPTAQQTTQG